MGMRYWSAVSSLSLADPAGVDESAGAEVDNDLNQLVEDAGC